MVESNKFNLREEELAEKVRKFTCFYGKGNGDYKKYIYGRKGITRGGECPTLQRRYINQFFKAV